MKSETTVNVNPDAIAKWERGDTQPKLDTWKELANFFNVSIEYLMGLSTSPSHGLPGMSNDKTQALTISYKTLFALLYLTYAHDTDISDNPNFVRTNISVENLTDYQKKLIARKFITWFEQQVKNPDKN